MRFRKLRIASSATCLIACVLLIVLWVRSVYTVTAFSGQVTRTKAFTLVSNRGFLGVLLFDPSERPEGFHKWGLRTFNPGEKSHWDFGVHTQSDRYIQIMVPCWFVLLIVA